jgi:hypothetical protein
MTLEFAIQESMERRPSQEEKKRFELSNPMTLCVSFLYRSHAVVRGKLYWQAEKVHY